MPRQMEFAGSPEDCALLLDRLGRHPGIARISLQVGASRMPEGDILTLEAANQTGCEIVKLLDELRLLERGAVSIGEPNATIRAEAARSLDEEGNDAVWEEIGAMMRQDTNPSLNHVALMALAGAVAAFGITSDTIHVVVGSPACWWPAARSWRSSARCSTPGTRAPSNPPPQHQPSPAPAALLPVALLYRRVYDATFSIHGYLQSDLIRPGSATRRIHASQQASTMASVELSRRSERKRSRR
jgi:hypothetical protein